MNYNVEKCASYIKGGCPHGRGNQRGRYFVGVMGMNNCKSHLRNFRIKCTKNPSDIF